MVNSKAMRLYQKVLGLLSKSDLNYVLVIEGDNGIVYDGYKIRVDEGNTLNELVDTLKKKDNHDN